MTRPGRFGSRTTLPPAAVRSTRLALQRTWLAYVGGVIVTSSQVNITQVPILGSLPLIGNLFKRNQTSVNSSELLFFLTPRIIPSA